jgi:hypothetical protein
MTIINWEILAKSLGLIGEDSEFSSTDDARKALQEIIGKENLKSAVEHHLSHRPGYELVGTVLQVLQPPYAMEICYSIYKSEDHTQQEKYSALALLKLIGNHHIAPWIELFFKDKDPNIQILGIEIADQMAYGGRFTDEQKERIGKLGSTHSNEHVKALSERILKYQ